MSETDVKELLEKEIATEIQSLSKLEAGSEKKSSAVDDLAKLYRLRIDENKSNWDADEKYGRREMEGEANDKDNQMKQKQLEEQVKDRYFKAGIAAAELMLPLIFYGIWMRKGFKFEESGTYTSKTFTGLINRFRPTKK